MRARMLDSRRDKARRGELRITVPVGYIWHREIGLGLDPDLRLYVNQTLCAWVMRKFKRCSKKRSVSSLAASANWAARGRSCCQ
jgi:hypothetical protein